MLSFHRTVSPERIAAIGGQFVRQTWQFDPALYAPPRYRRACAYDAFVPDPVATVEVSLPGDVAGIVADAERAIGSLNQAAPGALRPLARLLLRTESIASSRVEGLQVDARSLARAEANLDTGRPVGPDALAILANVDAMELAIERAAAEPSIEIDELIAVHRTLMARDVNARIAGRIRGTQNWIGGNDYNPCGADFVPPPPGHLAALLADLRDFCNDETLSPITQAAIAHAQFETIHPFEDGNGRTGRALVQVILRHRGLAPAYVPPISVMLARNRQRYLAGLTLFREDRLAEWIRLFAESAASAAHLARQYAALVAGLQQEWRRRLADSVAPRADAAAWALLDMLPAYPILTVAVAATALGRTRPAAANAINQLVDAGVLLPVSQSGQNRAWEADGLLELVVAFEAGDSWPTA